MQMAQTPKKLKGDLVTLTPQTNSTLEAIAERLRELDDFVLCGHVSPDGDCIGSMLALAHVLEAAGKKVICTRASTTPLDPTLSWLPGADGIVPASHVTKHHATFVGLDVPTRDRLGVDAQKLLDGATRTFTIDHHANEATMCEVVYVDPDAASCSIIVWELVKLMTDEIPRATALCCYNGLVSDTGCFCYQNTDPRAFASASEMIAYDIDPADVARNVYQNRSVASLKLDSLVVQRMRFSVDGLVVVSWITEQDLAALAAVKADVDPLIDTLRSIRGIEVACMLREQDGEVRGSLRAKNDLDISGIARSYGGGGHKAAAGFTLHVPIEEAIALVESDLDALVEESLERLS